MVGLFLASFSVGPQNRLIALLVWVADREGFEPSLPYGKHAFQACAIDHSAICPDINEDVVPLVLRGRNSARGG